MMRTRTPFLLLLSLAIAVVVVAVARPGLGGHSSLAQEPSGITMSLDMNADNDGGPCNSIDAAAEYPPGSDYKVAVCVSNLYYSPGDYGFPIGVVNFDVLYDDTLNAAPEVANLWPSLDDNPDANAGVTTWGDGLGSSFYCLGGGPDFFPTGDKDPATGPGHGDAFLSCKSAAGPWTLGDNETSGVIAVISFHASAAGIDNMTIAKGLLTYTDATEMGTCNPDITFSLDCRGGVETNAGTPVPTPTPTFTPTPPWCFGDADCDRVLDSVDNCSTVSNLDQTNTDAQPIDNGPVVTGDDITIPNSDSLGDACDPDHDNDWFSDAFEAEGCNSSGPMDPLMADSDGDRVVDGAECLLGSDPNDPNSKPSCVGIVDSDRDCLPDNIEALLGSNPNLKDTDGDGISDGTEVKGWATLPTQRNTDGDVCDDDKEIAEINGDGVVNALDEARIAQRAFNVQDDDPNDGNPVTDYDMQVNPAFDINKDGVINALDHALVVLNSNLVEPENECDCR